MKRIKRKNGFVLLLVVTMIPLIGVVIALMTANSKNLMVQTRTTSLQAHAQNACHSGLAWARQNPEKIKSLAPKKTILLTIQNENTHIYCHVDRILTDTGETEFQITGHAEDKRFSAKYIYPYDITD